MVCLLSVLGAYSVGWVWPRPGMRPGPVTTVEQVCLFTAARGEVCIAALGGNSFPELCPDLCCGSCSNQYCCSDVLKKLVWSKDDCAVPKARWVHRWVWWAPKGWPVHRGRVPNPLVLSALCR